MGTRAGSSYKEEILRFIHSKPNGVFEDDRVGVTGAVAEALMSAGLPIAASTVSSAFNTLRNEGRITVKYGHRSLDNHLLITEVTVISEPHEGVAVGPSSPVKQNVRVSRTDHRDDVVSAMLRKLIRLMQGQPSINDVEIERFQTHVDHLVDENEMWEALAQEAEDGFAEIIGGLRQQLAEASEHRRSEIDHLKATHANELLKAESRSSELRERAERYRLTTESVREELRIAQHEVNLLTSTMQDKVNEMTEQVAALTKRDENQRATITDLRNSVAQANIKLESAIDISVLRERFLVVETITPLMNFIVDLFSMVKTLEKHGKNIRIGPDVLVMLGMRNLNGTLVDTVEVTNIALRSVIDRLALQNELSPKNKSFPTAMTPKNLMHSIKTTKEILDQQVAPLPAKPQS